MKYLVADFPPGTQRKGHELADWKAGMASSPPRSRDLFKALRLQDLLRDETRKSKNRVAVIDIGSDSWIEKEPKKSLSTSVAPSGCIDPARDERKQSQGKLVNSLTPSTRPLGFRQIEKDIDNDTASSMGDAEMDAPLLDDDALISRASARISQAKGKGNVQEHQKTKVTSEKSKEREPANHPSQKRQPARGHRKRSRSKSVVTKTSPTASKKIRSEKTNVDGSNPEDEKESEVLIPTTGMELMGSSRMEPEVQEITSDEFYSSRVSMHKYKRFKLAEENVSSFVRCPMRFAHLCLMCRCLSKAIFFLVSERNCIWIPWVLLITTLPPSLD